jgi:hypothetical protein
MTGVGDGNNGPIGNAMGRIWRPGGETEALSRDVPAETPVAATSRTLPSAFPSPRV